MGVCIKLFEFREKSEDSLSYRCRSKKTFFLDLTNYCCIRNMNKANKIDARCSVAQAIQRNWRGYLRSLNEQQFFGIVRKGNCLFSKS